MKKSPLKKLAFHSESVVEKLGIFLSALATMAIVVVMVSSCGVNIFNGIAPGKTEKKVVVEDARVKMDTKDYEGAVSLLTPLQEDAATDSNEVRLLLASAMLGQAGIDIWSIINKILESTTSSTSTQSGSKSTGLDNILDALSSNILGTGDEKIARLAALNKALNLLRSAPNATDSKITNTACFFAGILVVPTVLDATSALTETASALDSLSTSVAAGNACTVGDTLSTSLTRITSLASLFSDALAAVKGCAFINLSDSTAQLNAIETRLAKLTANADKGCSLTSCPGCDSIFPSCVQSALGVGTSGANDGSGDGKINGCELLIHCTPFSNCF